MPGRDTAATTIPDPAAAEVAVADELLFRKGSATAIRHTLIPPSAAPPSHGSAARPLADNLLAKKKGAAGAERSARPVRNYDHKASLDVAPPPEAGRSPDMEEPEGSWYKYDGAAPAPPASLIELDENAPTSWYKYEPEPVRPAVVKSDLAAPASLSIRGFAPASAPPEPHPAEAPGEAWETALAASTVEVSAPAPVVATPDVPASVLQEVLTQVLAASPAESEIAPALPAMDAEAAEAFARDLALQEAWSSALAASTVEIPSAPEPPVPSALPAMDAVMAQDFLHDRDLRDAWEATLAASGVEEVAAPPTLPQMDAAMAEEFSREREMSEAWASALAASGAEESAPPLAAVPDDLHSTEARESPLAASVAEIPASIEVEPSPAPAPIDVAAAEAFARDEKLSDAWTTALAASAVDAPLAPDIAPSEDHGEARDTALATSPVAAAEELLPSTIEARAEAAPPLATSDQTSAAAASAERERVAAETVASGFDREVWEATLAASTVAPEERPPPALEAQAEVAPAAPSVATLDEPLLLTVLAPPEPIAALPDAAESTPSEDDGEAWESALAASTVASEAPAPLALEAQAIDVQAEAAPAASPAALNHPEPIATLPDATESESSEDGGQIREFALVSSTIAPQELAPPAPEVQAEFAPAVPSVPAPDEPPALAVLAAPEPIAAPPDTTESAPSEDAGETWESALAASTIAAEQPAPLVLKAQALEAEVDVAPVAPSIAAPIELPALAALAAPEPIAALPDASERAPREDGGEISEPARAASAAVAVEELVPPQPLAEAQPVGADVPMSLTESEPLAPEAPYIEPPRDEVAPPSARAEPETLTLEIPLAAGDPLGIATEGEEQEIARSGDGPIAEPELARPLAVAPALAEPPRSPPPLPRGIPIYGAAAAPGLRGPADGDAGSRVALAEDLAEMIGSMLSSTEFATNVGAKAREAERPGASNSCASTESFDEALMQALPPPPPAPVKRRGWTDHAMGLAVAGMMAAGGYFAYSLYFTEHLLAHESSTVVAMALLPPPAPDQVSAAAIEPASPETAAPKPTPAAARAAPAAKDARAKRAR